MPTIFWDFETRSAINLETAGAWRYASDPTTEILCIGYAIDDGNPQIWIPGSGDPIPEVFIAAATDSAWRVVAHNYQFERAIATRILTPRFNCPEIPIERQVCTMTLALAGALPRSLDNAVMALGLPLQKDQEGYTLMRKMSRPLPLIPQTQSAGTTARKMASDWVSIASAMSSLSAWCIARCPRCRPRSRRSLCSTRLLISAASTSMSS